jgi:hypothetical protein
MTSSLRTVVATTLATIHADNGYIAPTRNATTNTQTKVLATLKRTPNPTNLEPEFYQFADEMIGFFRSLETMPNYKDILALPDGSVYKTCAEVAKSEELTTATFPFAVAMPNLYSKLKPPKPKKLNALNSQAKVIKPGNYMGKLNEEDRFFVKLVRVGANDPTRGGTLFEVHDRNGNVGFFYEKVEKLEGVIELGTCFAMHATPTRQTPTKDGEKHTVFRTVSIIKDTIVAGKGTVDPKDDATGGKFTKNVPF